MKNFSPRALKNYDITLKGIALELLTITLSAGAIAALIATTITLFVKAQSWKSERLEQEHSKRRSELRELANFLTKATVANETQTITLLCSQLGLNLNPADNEDVALIQAAERLVETEEKSARIKEFTERMALLLNYEDNKKTRKYLPWYSRAPQPRRIKYEECLTPATKLGEADKKWSWGWQLAYYFGMLTFFAGVLFFIAAGFTKPFQDLVLLFNDPKNQFPVEAWLQFSLTSIIGGSLWAIVYLCFKASEKRILEVIFTK